MNNQLKQLEKELEENEAIYDRARLALSGISQESDKLNQQIYNLLPEDVPAFAARRRALDDEGELYRRIVNDRQARLEQLRGEIREEQLKARVAEKDRKGERIEEIMSKLPFLPITSAERADLQAELNELK